MDDTLERTYRVLSVMEVASLLKVDRKTVYEAAARGTIPHRRLGKRIIFCRKALLDWLSCKGSSSN